MISVKSESSLESKVCTYAKFNGCLCYKLTPMGQRGAPDRLIVTPCGQVIFMEFKTKKGRLSELQKHQIGKLKQRGANVFAIDDYEHAKNVINGLIS